MPTIFDVAAAAGVSHQTVSRVLNGDDRVRPHNRERVLDAVAALDYRPHAAARALARRRSGVLGVLRSDAELFGPVSIARAFTAEAASAGYTVASLAVGSEADAVGAAVEALLLQQVQAIVLVSPSDPLADAVRRLVPNAVPVLSTAGRGRGAGAASLDQRAGGALATEHLIRSGRRRIGHLAGPAEWWDAREREAGWALALERAGLEPGPVVAGDWSAASGADAATRFGDCDAVFSANDTMALGLLHALAGLGRSVPGDVAVVGHDDIPEARFLIPALTSVRQDHAALGARLMGAVAALLDGAEARDAPAPAPELLARTSG
ncbi:LacI family DNA-binding transcriptional regulator [Arenivirga flava]|uniref:LacI family transcriptional regulator n=1 Tax=Arenivirga flava TaxID=1930060 RepID=A0AA37UJ54_9MICO|nr:substrate-binding domain-containing protein [Arenivirga flava]GMA27905.1 LacI family transcriptional regulator [Arenivirga flava]